jgi:two-component system cell cycle sensor histidine kinase PleC
MSAEHAIAPIDAATQAREQKLVLDQLGMALRNLRPNAWMMPALAAVICVMYSHWVPLPRLGAWFAIVVLTVLPLGYVSRRFGHVRSAAQDPRRRVLVSTLAYCIFTLGWSSLGLLLWVDGQDLPRLIVIMLLACTVAGNGALVGASRPLTVVSYASYGGTLILTPLQAGDFIYAAISVLAILYVGYMLFMSRQIYLTARDMLLLKYEKNDLIEALARSKEESDRAREHAEGASRAKSEFLANMSHELRTPLNAILGFSEMITSRVFAHRPEKQYEYAGLIHSSGFHLLTLINDILDLAKIESGSWTLRETDVDLAALIADACTMMAPKADAGGCTLAVEIAPGLPPVNCDARAIRQVLLNLASNAVKFTPGGGRIVLFARQEPSGEIAFGVGDTGVGIASEDQARVFENFGQGRHDVVTADKGTGLGLPIVKGLVEAHDGRIALESQIGEGTTVTVFLPARRAVADAPLKAAS